MDADNIPASGPSRIATVESESFFFSRGPTAPLVFFSKTGANFLVVCAVAKKLKRLLYLAVLEVCTVFVVLTLNAVNRGKLQQIDIEICVSLSVAALLVNLAPYS